MAEPREVMTIRQLAEYLDISEDTVYGYAAQGKMPGFKLGNRWRFKRSLIDQWMVLQTKEELERRDGYGTKT